MITPTKAWATSDGMTHSTLDQAKEHALYVFPLNANGDTFAHLLDTPATPDLSDRVVGMLVANADALIKILAKRERKSRAKKVKTARRPKPAPADIIAGDK